MCENQYNFVISSPGPWCIAFSTTPTTFTLIFLLLLLLLLLHYYCCITATTPGTYSTITLLLLPTAPTTSTTPTAPTTHSESFYYYYYDYSCSTSGIICHLSCVTLSDVCVHALFQMHFSPPSFKLNDRHHRRVKYQMSYY